MLREAGFSEVELVRDTGFNSSPVTRGVLFRARKLGEQEKVNPIEDNVNQPAEAPQVECST
jgi:hypothetical protein